LRASALDLSRRLYINFRSERYGQNRFSR
jgi:hypothetical protein